MKLNYRKLNNKEYTFLEAKIKIMSQLTIYLYFQLVFYNKNRRKTYKI